MHCLIDVVSAPDHRVRNVQKLWWILLVLFFPLVGSIRPDRFVATEETQGEEFLRGVRERAEEQRRRREQDADAADQ